MHAHAVAAGFCARAGALDEAGRHVAAVADLGGWRADDSYLRSVFVRELARAAIALEDRALCAELLEYVRPLAGSCAVNGAMVAFAGSHAQTAGLLAAALGEVDRPGRCSPGRGDVPAAGRGGARRGERRPEPPHVGRVRRGIAVRRGPVWQVTWPGTATVPHSKGLADIARLLPRPGPTCTCSSWPAPRTGPGRPASWSTGRRWPRTGGGWSSWRREAAARPLTTYGWPASRRSGRPWSRSWAGSPGAASSRAFANHPAERARKAVSGRFRDAVRKLPPCCPSWPRTWTGRWSPGCGAATAESTPGGSRVARRRLRGAASRARRGQPSSSVQVATSPRKI